MVDRVGGLNVRDAAMFRENGRGGELPRSFDRVDEAALVEQGMTPGMVVSSPQPGLNRDELFSRMAVAQGGVLPVNPEPQEGLDYWVWISPHEREMSQWVPARYHTGTWLPCHNRVQAIPADAVKFWRGPMVPPEAPTPAQVDAALGRKRLVHEVHDLEASG